MKIGFVGGGTGGHFYPLIAVVEELRASGSNADLYYFGPDPYNQQLLTNHNIQFIYCPAGKLRRYFSIQNLFDAFRSLFGIFVAIWKLYVIYPDVIFSKGSYTAVPILLAARFLRIPVVIHESDSKPGRANLLAKKFARYIAISYDDAALFFPPEKTALVGIPLRREITTINTDAHTKLGIPNDKPLLYITGGSMGAERINNIILVTLLELLQNFRVFHQVGDANLAEIKADAEELLHGNPLGQNYYVVGSVPGATVSLLLDAAALVITRAGSTTLFEIAHHRKPAIIIPIPEEISHDQRLNAYAYARSGAGEVIEEKNLTPHLLIDQIRSIIGDQAKWSAMSAAAGNQSFPDAAAKIATLLLSIGKEHE
jgi:UDP-N-acetylglucosamine--N-acetylmuramyl-(pentapeptide) pyrophosphoryl-undecaprenol N-acetylglucosamine transferase